MFSEPEPAFGVQAVALGGKAQCHRWLYEVAGRIQEQRPNRADVWEGVGPGQPAALKKMPVPIDTCRAGWLWSEQSRCLCPRRKPQTAYAAISSELGRVCCLGRTRR